MAYKRLMTRLILLLCLVAAPALGHPPHRPLAGEPPTQGVHLGTTSLVSSNDAAGVEVNPATLGLLPSWSLLLHHAEIPGDGRFNGGGDALLAAFPMPFAPSLAFGMGLQWLRPADAVGYADSAKISFSMAAQVQGKVSLGLNYHTFISDKDSALDSLDALDVGLVLRPYEWLGAGLVVRDLNTPVYDGLPLQRVYDLELMARPLSTGRLELGAGLRIGERRGDLDPHFRLEVEPIRGLRLLSQVSLMNRDFYRVGDETMDVRVTVGLALNLEQVGLAVTTLLGRHLDPGAGPLATCPARSPYQGVGISLKLQGARQPPLIATTHKLLDLELKESLNQHQWVRVVSLLHRIERRPDILGIMVEIDGFQAGWAHAQELRRWFKRLRRAGKKIYVYLRAPGAREYYVAAAADRVLLDPAGGIQLAGLAKQTLYFRGLLDKISVAPQAVRIAEFKSAPEAFMRSTASEPARRMRQAILDDLYSQLLHGLAKDRNKTTAKIQSIIEQGPFTPPRALELGLVDELVEPGELQKSIERRAGASLVKADGLTRSPERWPVGPGVAVILVEGDIVRGKSQSIPLLGRKLVGDDSIAKALAWARASESVRAVVLRVDSPGGSAMAGDRMWREVRRTRKIKPLVVSMGDMAASGGYLVAADADRIFAEHATITGSIGIFTYKFDLGGLLERIGISVDTYAKGKRSLLNSFTRPWSDEDRAFILSRLQHYYRAFLRAVSKGRKMTMDQVHEVAKGRVWTGKQAKAKGLVDAHGGLMDAIEEAKRRAGLPLDRPVRLFVLPRPEKGLLSRMMHLLGSNGEPALPDLPPPVVDALKGIPPVLLKARSGEPLARMPFDVLID